jgi:hypothetical protein
LTKILGEVLRGWSDDAVKQKKVLAFAARLPGQMSLPERGRDLLIALMELLERTRVLAEGLGALARLPGGYQASLPDGTRLADLFLRLNFLQEIRIPQVRSALFGSIADPAQAASIERVFRLKVRIREDRLRLAQENLRGALATYRDYLASRTSGAVASGRSSAEAGGAGSAGGTQLQISDTFLTKLMELGRGNEDIQYRTSLVEKIRDERLQVATEESALRETREILEALAKDPPVPEKTPAPAKAKIPAAPTSGTDFAASLNLGCREMNALIVDTEKLRAKVTENYMSPQTSLYRITVPVIAESSSPLTMRNAGLFLAAFIGIGLGIALAACWAHDQARSVGDLKK